MTKRLKWIAACALASALLVSLSLAQTTESPAVRVEQIFKKHCIVCHGRTNPRSGLNLEPGNWIAAMVNVASREKPKLKLVAPRDLEKSYLLQKIRGDEGIGGRRMPYRKDPLAAEDVNAIEAWVLSLGS